MSHPSAYHQLGRFIVAFQHLEGTVDDHEYGKRLNTVDVLFAPFVDIRTNTDAASKAELRELG